MNSNNFTMALRAILKHKTYSLITIAGLAMGMAAALLILLYIRFESRYDSFHANADNLYRVSIRHFKQGKVEGDGPYFTPPLGPAMAREIPGVKSFTRVSSARVAHLSYSDKTLKAGELRYADSTFFELFSFELLSGSREHALVQPHSILLTKGLAQRLFGEENPVGKSVRINAADVYAVTGVVNDPPPNSHLQFDALVSFSTLSEDPNLFLDWDGGNQYACYVMLESRTGAAEVEAKLPELMWKHINSRLESIGVRYEPYLQPLERIHLFYSPGSESTRTNLAVFAVVAGLVVLIACVNYTNMTTARATRRAKEIGVRKILGAHRSTLIGQFLSESFLASFLALIGALFLAELIFPAYQEVVGKELSLPPMVDLETTAALMAMFVLVGLAGGSYPAFYLSSLQSTHTMKGMTYSGKLMGRSRNVLVVGQFAVAIALIVCTGVVTHQLSFTKSKNLGFQKEGIVVFPLVGDLAKTRAEELQQELSAVSGVVSVAASSDVPSDGFTSNGYFPEGHSSPMMINVVDIDEKFLSTFDIPVVRGRNFSREIQSERGGYMINETLARELGWDDPIGKRIRRNGEHQIIGVVKDFHYATLRDKLEPLILTNEPWRDRFSFLSVRLAPGAMSERMTALRGAWERVAPDAPFDYWFLDESYDQLYKSEQRFQKLFLAFSAMTIGIALLGLLSLAAFATEQRTKEIGIRKILGASVVDISASFSKEFVRLVLLANLFAWPAAYYFMTSWLENFAYRVELEWWLFVGAGGLALIIALVTVSLQTVKAALANPVEALRYE
ncbi:MAG: ABC transporter permease [Ignavibacteriales bacterium]|nr:ABC transporter permease [Ignavibacteriales bacterium]